MKGRFILVNLALIAEVICLIGGGIIAPYGYFALLALIALLVICFPKYLWKNFSAGYFVALIIFILYYLITSGFNINSASVFFSQFSTILIANVFFDIVEDHQDLKPLFRWFCLAVLSIMAVYCIRSLLFIRDNPMALRELVSVSEDETVVIGGGYGLPYAMTILVPMMVLLLRNLKKKWLTLLFFILFITLGAYLVIRALYMTALVIFVIGLIWAIIYDWPKTKKILVLTICVIVVPLTISYLPTLMEIISPDETTVLTIRADELSTLVTGDSIGGTDINARFVRSVSSVKTFLNNPLLGVGWKVGYDFYSMEAMGVGSHAEWFDIFARYGLFAILLIIVIVSGTRKYIKKRNLSLSLFVIVGFFNPLFVYPLVFTAFYLAPALRYCFQPENGNHFISHE